MNYRILIFSLVIAITVSGCRGLKETAFHVENPIHESLPPLYGSVNIDNLITQIGTGRIVRRTYNYSEDERETKLTYKYDLRIYDFMALFRNELGLTKNQDTTNHTGFMHFEILSHKEKRNPFLGLYTIFTLCSTCLLGAPVINISTAVEIRVCIYNEYDEIISTYTSKGKGIAFVAMYWGYGEDAWRKSSLMSFKDALNKIKPQIEEDKEMIAQKLLN